MTRHLRQSPVEQELHQRAASYSWYVSLGNEMGNIHWCMDTVSMCLNDEWMFVPVWWRWQSYEQSSWWVEKPFWCLQSPGSVAGINCFEISSANNSCITWDSFSECGLGAKMGCSFTESQTVKPPKMWFYWVESRPSSSWFRVFHLHITLINKDKQIYKWKQFTYNIQISTLF